MLSNAYLLAKIGADTAKKRAKLCRKFAKNWQLPNYPTLYALFAILQSGRHPPDGRGDPPGKGRLLAALYALFAAEESLWNHEARLRCGISEP